jgi:hypothetical protein
VVGVMRTMNMVVEIFIDVAEDGAAYAEALMLRDADKSLLGQGSARIGPEDGGLSPGEETQLAARALIHLAETLLPARGA